MMLALGLFRDAYLKFLLLASPAYTLLLARGVTWAQPACCCGAWAARRCRARRAPAAGALWAGSLAAVCGWRRPWRVVILLRADAGPLLHRSGGGPR